MDFEVAKGKALTRQETKVLLDLIENSQVIMSKNTTATSNLLKKKEWARLAKLFNSTPTVLCHRTPQQLRLKWENLKKNCRRRITKIRLASIASKSEGGPKEFIHPDEVLDKVDEMLRRKASKQQSKESYTEMQSIDESSSDGLSEEFNQTEDQLSNSMDTCENSPAAKTKETINTPIEVPIDNIEVPGGTNQMWLGQASTRIFSRRGKKKVIGDRGRTARNLAIAEYYKTKKKCLDAKLNTLLLENKKVELENKKLILEILQIMKK